ncbi:MAG TPA: hypothetical protein VEZ90_00030 [Blastocatellia bacterium]|nr:hypothetical protein [Blastocatellia bacterium]
MAVEVRQCPLAETVAPPLGMPGIKSFDFEKSASRAVPAQGTIPFETALEVGDSHGVSRSGPGPTQLAAGDLSIELPEIGLSLSTPIAYVHLDLDAGKVDFGFEIDFVAAVAIHLTGDVVSGGARFSAREVSIQVSPIGHAAAAEFVASSLTAALALSDCAVLRALRGEVRFGAFNLKLREISDLLRNRETARRLMVIGKACGYGLVFPPHLSGAEVQAIAFIHHATVDRTFVWPIHRHPMPMAANERNLEMLRAHGQPARIAIPRRIVESLLGQEIDLGTVNIVMEDAIVEDADRVVSEASKLDGHEVQTFVRSLAGRATIECPEAPTLPPNPWTPNEEALMVIEGELVTRITDRYNALAASTLEGLTEEQKAELTNPEPSLGELLAPDEDRDDD